MTVTATLPASPELCCGRRHDVEGRSGLTRVIMMKLLGHADAETPDTVASLMRITARGAAQIHQTSLILDVVPITAAGVTTVGVLIALCTALFFQKKSADGLRSGSEIRNGAGYPEVGKVGADHAIHRIA